MKQPHWLTTADVLKLHRMQINEFGGATHLRDYGLLESAVIRPHQRYHYGELSTIPELAAAYAIALSANHPFADGNKRTAFESVKLFRTRNQIVTGTADPQLRETVRLVATHVLTDVQQIAKSLKGF